MAIYEVHHYNPETNSVDVNEIEAVSFKTARDGNSVTFYNSIYAGDQNKVAFFNKVVSIWKTEKVHEDQARSW